MVLSFFPTTLLFRSLHDPVPNALHIHSSQRVVIAEGLFLLLDKGDWSKVGQAFDVRIFLGMPLQSAREIASARKSLTNNISSM